MEKRDDEDENVSYTLNRGTEAKETQSVETMSIDGDGDGNINSLTNESCDLSKITDEHNKQEIVENSQGENFTQQSVSNEVIAAKTQAILTTEETELNTMQIDFNAEVEAVQMTKNKTKLIVQTDHVPKLKGDKGFVIDFETNDLKPMPITGVDELFNRFMKSAVVRTHSCDTQDVRFVL